MVQNAKPKIDHEALKSYLDIVEAPRAQNRRYVAIIAMLAGVCLVLAIGMAAMAPMRERVPYFVTFEAATGRVELSDRVAQRFSPSDDAVKYFVRRFVVDSYTIDESTRSTRLPGAYALLRGAAIDAWNRQVWQREDPVGKLSNSPTFRRSVEFVAPPQIVADGAIIVRIALVEGRDVVARRQVSLRYALLPVEDDEDVARNPIGLWITDFGVVDEAS